MSNQQINYLLTQIFNLQDAMSDLQSDNKRMKQWIKRNKLVGRTYGNLTVIGRDEHVTSKDGRRRRATWSCLCACGRVVRQVHAFNLKNGNTKSCGCLGRAVRHGHTVKGAKSPTYSTWQNMLTRCSCESHSGYSFYSKIGVCDEWKDFQSFLEDMGEKPASDFHIHRVDNTKPYEPGNCVWISARNITNYMERRVGITTNQ